MPSYRFPDWKGDEFNSRARHEEKYEVIEPYLGQDSVGAEIGVSKGGFGELLLPHCKMLFLVDPWWRRDDEARSVRDVYENDDNVVIARKRSDQFMPEVPDNSFDFFYVDGCHKYNTVMHDLTVGFEKLKPGGRIIGDDWAWMTVRLAVQHFSEATGIAFTQLRSDQWVVHKPV